MDTARWESTAIVKKLVEELRDINDHLESLHEEIKHYCDAIETNSKREESQPVWLKQILDKCEDTEEKTKTDRDRQHIVQNSLRWASWFTFIATLLAFVAAALYAWEAHQQLDEMALARNQVERSVILGMGQLAIANRNAKSAEDTLANTEKSFQIDERPYIVVASNPTFAVHGLVANEKLIVNLTLKNIGKSPAISATTVTHLRRFQIPKAKPEVQRSALRGFLDTQFTDMRRENSNSRNELVRLAGHHAGGTDTAPGEEYFFSTNDDVRLTPEELKILLTENPDFVLVFIATTTYLDGAANPYETTLCRMFFGPYPNIWHRCDAYNTLK